MTDPTTMTDDELAKAICQLEPTETGEDDEAGVKLVAEAWRRDLDL